MTSDCKPTTGQAKLYPLAPRFAVSPAPGGGWKVHPEGQAASMARPGSYALACALARFLNGQDAEPADVEALANRVLNLEGIPS